MNLKQSFFTTTALITTTFITLSGCGTNDSQNIAAKSVERAFGDKVILFAGTSLDQWQMAKPEAWKIEDGAMFCTGNGDIWTTEQFGNYVFECDFKMSSECNSGIFLRTGDPKDPVQTGMEIQVLDSYGKEIPDKHDCGAFYDLLEPSENVAKAPGEWNHIIITCHDTKITVVLNNVTIIEADVNNWPTAHMNPDGTENKFNAPLKDFPRAGLIGFQDHGHPVWYKNVTLEIL